VAHLQRIFGVSERRCCKVVGQHRTTQRYRAITPDEERQLVKAMLDVSRRHPRYGYRRITALLRRAGWLVNRKRIQRLSRQQGLKVPRKQHKRRRLGSSANSCSRRAATQRNHVWTYDFVFDRTEDGRRLKFLTVVDEFTRECLALPVAQHFTAQDVVAVLAELVAERGAPAFIRSDNGPEFIALAVRAWLARAGIETAFIEPGAPWENAYSETDLTPGNRSRRFERLPLFLPRMQGEPRSMTIRLRTRSRWGSSSGRGAVHLGAKAT